MGRPKLAIVKNKTITVHCSHSDYVIIKAKAKQCGLGMSQYLLALGVDKKIKSVLSGDELDCYRKIAGMANNLNQISKSLNKGLPFNYHYETEINVLKEILSSFI